MNASKEQAKKAHDSLEQAARLLNVAVPDEKYRNEIKSVLMVVGSFIVAAERKLPSEAAYEKEKNKKRKPASV